MIVSLQVLEDVENVIIADEVGKCGIVQSRVLLQGVRSEE